MPDKPHSSSSTLAETQQLINLGRDREALAAATRQGPPGGPMDGAEQLDQLMPLLVAVVGRIEPGQLADPTPCANFTVAGVLDHMIGGASAFAPAFRGEPAPAVEPAPPEGNQLERFGQAMADLLDAVHSPGAQDRIIAAPIGEVPGAVFARFVAFDGLVHGWDLATATGQTYAPAESLVAEVDAFARQALTPEMRDGDTFATEADAPDEADPLERLVAFSGRQLPDKETNR